MKLRYALWFAMAGTVLAQVVAPPIPRILTVSAPDGSLRWCLPGEWHERDAPFFEVRCEVNMTNTVVRLKSFTLRPLYLASGDTTIYRWQDTNSINGVPTHYTVRVFDRRGNPSPWSAPKAVTSYK